MRAALDHFQAPERWAAAQAAGRWERHEFAEIAGSRWVVVGLGSIGREVARLALGVRGPSRGRAQASRPPRDPGVRGDARRRSPTCLRDADVVALCAPSNASTRHLVDASFLGAMQQSALLINIGRGSVVDEEALLAALDAGSIAAAALDVFETEPLPADSPLWDAPPCAC